MKSDYERGECDSDRRGGGDIRVGCCVIAQSGEDMLLEADVAKVMRFRGIALAGDGIFRSDGNSAESRQYGT